MDLPQSYWAVKHLEIRIYSVQINKIKGEIIMGKLEDLMEVEGYEDVEELMADIQCDSTNPGICMNSGCEYVTTVEPDSDEGWCELCETNTVKSATNLILF